MANEPLILAPDVVRDEDLHQDQTPVLSTHADLGTTPSAAAKTPSPAPGSK